MSDDPISPDVQSYLRAELGARYGGPCREYRSWLMERIAGARVLDVGVVEHSRHHTTRAGWMHAEIARHAVRAVGVDILEDDVATLNARGFDVRVADATSTVDLGERFDVAVIGDVIEHVNDAVALLTFCKRHLDDSGRIIVKTPNPHWWRHVLHAARGPFLGNAEHVAWVSPFMAKELAGRAGLDLDTYHVVVNSGSTATRRTVFKLATSLGLSDEVLGPAYVYVFAP